MKMLEEEKRAVGAPCQLAKTSLHSLIEAAVMFIVKSPHSPHISTLIFVPFLRRHCERPSSQKRVFMSLENNVPIEERRKSVTL